jgi:hypothetical protein
MNTLTVCSPFDDFICGQDFCPQMAVKSVPCACVENPHSIDSLSSLHIARDRLWSSLSQASRPKWWLPRQETQACGDYR